jgi:hypothetical protein
MGKAKPDVAGSYFLNWWLSAHFTHEDPDQPESSRDDHECGVEGELEKSVLLHDYSL